MAVFGNVGLDIILTFLFGFIGGLGAELIDNKGSVGIFSFEKDDKGQNTNKYNLGFLSKMIIGGIAALAFLFLVDATDPAKFVGATVAAGFGGSATLVAVKEKIFAGKKDGLADLQSNNARDASKLNEQILQQMTTKGLVADTELDNLKKDAEGLKKSIEQTDIELKKLR